MRTIRIAGAGNIAQSLIPALTKSGNKIDMIFDHVSESAKMLAEKSGCSYTDSVSELCDGAFDFLFLLLPDDVIVPFLEKIGTVNSVLIHCSGTLDIDVLKKFSDSCGVVYPLQTFSKEKPVDLINIPVFIEGNSLKVEKLLFEMANSFSQKVIILSSEKRIKLHLAAVFGSNFSNFLMMVSNEILEKEGLGIDILEPIMRETFDKIFLIGPEKSLTGPARRNDVKTMEKHLSLLSKETELQEIYRLISNEIIRKIKK